MNAIEVYNTINNYLADLKNTYGDDIEYIEAYDGKITIHFKKDFLEEKIAEAYLKTLSTNFLICYVGGTTNENRNK